MDEFTVHRLNDRGLQRAEAIAEAFGDLLARVDDLVEVTYERHLIVEKLQEACFFSKRSIALEPKNQLGYAPHNILTDQDENWCANDGCTNKRAPNCDGARS